MGVSHFLFGMLVMFVLLTYFPNEVRYVEYSAYNFVSESVSGFLDKNTSQTPMDQEQHNFSKQQGLTKK